MEVYIPDVVSDIRNYHDDIIRNIWKYNTVRVFLSDYAKSLADAHRSQAIGFANEVNNYYKPLIGKPTEEIWNKSFTELEYFDISATVHGFTDFSVVDENTVFNENFERGVEAILHGDLAQLKKLIDEDKSIISQVSSFGHHATLLHYCSSNGVELWRQMVPHNLDLIVSLLLEKGADPRAKMKVYGGEFTFEELFLTSAHPPAAGVVEKVRAVINDLK